MTQRSLPQNSSSEDATWQNLQQVIAGSSGFQRWLAERALTATSAQGLSLEQLVICYLRETLETLAY